MSEAEADSRRCARRKIIAGRASMLRLYKEENAAPFKAVSRQTLFSDARLAGELRYFEVEPGGYSTLERHEHMHAVMILRGHGEVLVGGTVHQVKPHDLITIPPWAWHQFRPAAAETLGFLCLVNARTRPAAIADGGGDGGAAGGRGSRAVSGWNGGEHRARLDASS